MIKEAIKRNARKLGVNFTSTMRLGVDLELDLARLTAGDALATIFDVGGNVGQTALQYAEAFPNADVFTFEPVPVSFERLAKTVGPYPRIKPFNIGLGEKAGVMKMNISHDSLTNSILSVSYSTESVDTQIDTVDSVAEKNGVATIDLLKIDVEGYELQVLKGASNLLAGGKIRFVFAECAFSPDTDPPHTSFFALHQALEQAGFCFVNYYAVSFRLKIGCALGNVLYALRSKLPAHPPDEIKNIW